MGRNKVLQYGQTFAEVRGNRRFDNRAVRFRHQTTHTGQLFNLSRRTTGTRVGHHVNRVEGLLINFVAVTVDNFLFGQVVHHRFSDLIAGTTPNIDHFVVTFAVGDQTLTVLVFDFFNFGISFGQQGCFFFRNFHIVNRNGNTAFSRKTETGIHQVVGENNCVTQAAQTERCVNQLGNFFFLQRFVDVLERQAFRQDFAQQCTADSRFVTVNNRLKLTCFVFHPFAQTYGNFRTQFNLFGMVCTMHFFHIGKQAAFAFGIDTVAGHVVQTQYDILGRYDNRFAVGRRQYVV